MRSQDGRQRVIIEGVEPEIDGGRFPAKRIVGEPVAVHADIFADGHDLLSAVLRHRHAEETAWQETSMEPALTDRWRGVFTPTRLGRYFFTLLAWVDPFKTWRRDLFKKIQAGQDVAVDLRVGVYWVEAVLGRHGEGVAPAPTITPAMKPPMTPEERDRLQAWVGHITSLEWDVATRASLALDEDVATLMARHADRSLATRYDHEVPLTVDRPRARFGAWYEMFPRSSAPEPGRHGTFKDCEARLPYVAAMGFDVLYLPPIHPIGQTHRKGRNGAPEAGPDDPGSPWAIGAEAGGHLAIQPELGTLADFQSLQARAGELGIELALDIAFQCAPDHPLVKAHPEFFRRRPDSSIQYAENPPKKYEDIYPFDFESSAWPALWEELRGVFFYWIEQGVRLFRVDNPHTKPFGFWEWVIGEVKRLHPDVLFLAEAFTRPKIMDQLAKLGFSQSYTYFTWRNTSVELTRYFTELSQPGRRDYFRSNLWPNTPDILSEYLQTGGRAAFVARLTLAATLGANYGIYGPPFELCEARARAWGSEEYRDSEKYEICHWDIERPDNLMPLIALINRIRHENPALHDDASLQFHPTNNEQLVCYSKQHEASANTILVVVNLDPHHTQSGWVELEPQRFGDEAAKPFQVHDLLSDARYIWQGTRNYVELDPRLLPASIFRLRRRIRSEHDFEYFM